MERWHRLAGEGAAQDHELNGWSSVTSKNGTGSSSGTTRRLRWWVGSKKGRRLGNSCGTNSQPWQDFGKGIPVLFVYDDSGRCVDVYPHNTSAGTDTISDYLESLNVLPRSLA